MTSTEWRKSPLHAQHEALGATFTQFGGWEMPLKYTSELDEHRAVRESVGLFDLSHMGEIRVTGKDAVAFLDHVLISAIAPILVGKAKYTMLVQEDGGIIDDLIVYRLGDAEFMLVPNASNRQEVFDVLSERIGGYDVTLSDESGETVLLAVQGPRAIELLETLVPEEQREELHEMRYYSCGTFAVNDVHCLVSRTGYTGEDGFEIYVRYGHGAEIWNALLGAGNAGVKAEVSDDAQSSIADEDDPIAAAVLSAADDKNVLTVTPCGLAARDSLRLEAGMPLYGKDLGRDRTPLEAGMQLLLGPMKRNYIGRSKLVNQPQPDQVLVGLKGSGRRAARSGYEIFDKEGKKVGVVTSGVLSPTLGYPIALAYVDRWLSKVGTELEVDIRGTRHSFVVTPTPFYNRKKRK